MLSWELVISKAYFCRIITQLENLKKEAAEVAKKMEETDTVMAEVDRVSQEYMPLSTSCSSIYFTLEGLNQVGLGVCQLSLTVWSCRYTFSINIPYNSFLTFFNQF